MRSLAAVIFLSLLATPPGRAAEVVVFHDGRTLEVEAWEAAGEQAILELKGGGRIQVPLSRIVTVNRLPEATESGVASNGVPHPTDPAEKAWRELAGEYADLIALTAERHGVEPGLLAAMAKVESDFDPYAVSNKGACGLLQLLPSTAERFGVESIFDVDQNLDGGARYLRWLLDRFGGSTELAVAAYNAGEEAVDRHGGIPPFPETRAYVSRVMERARD